LVSSRDSGNSVVVTVGHGGDPTSALRRLHARLAGRQLDRRLAGGVDPQTDELLVCRAELLVRPPFRHLVAEGLRGALARAYRWRPAGSAVPVAASSVRMYADELLALAARLDSYGPVGARGVSRARLLLLDGTSPLYRPGNPLRLQSALERALAGLGDEGAAPDRVLKGRLQRVF